MAGVLRTAASAVLNKLDPKVADELVDIALAGWKQRDNMAGDIDSASLIARVWMCC